MKFILPLALLVASANVFAQSTHACKLEAYLADTSTGKSNVRNAPNGKVIVTLINKALADQPDAIVTKKVTIIGQNGEWFQISKLVTDTSAEGQSSLPRFTKPAQDMAFVHKSIIAVRSKDTSVGIPVLVEPNGRDANVKSNMGLLTQNVEQKISGCSGEFAQVLAANGAIGYAHSMNLSADKLVPVVAEPEVTVDPTINGSLKSMSFKKRFAGELKSEVTPVE